MFIYIVNFSIKKSFLISAWCKSLTLVEHSAVNRVVARSSRAGGAKRTSAIAGVFFYFMKFLV